MTNLYCKVRSSLASKKGQGLVEYGLILAGVAVVGVAVFTLWNGDLGTAIVNVFNDIESTLTTDSAIG